METPAVRYPGTPETTCDAEAPTMVRLSCGCGFRGPTAIQAVTVLAITPDVSYVSISIFGGILRNLPPADPFPRELQRLACRGFLKAVPLNEPSGERPRRAEEAEVRSLEERRAVRALRADVRHRVLVPASPQVDVSPARDPSKRPERIRADVALDLQRVLR